jgi:hypothetical protein
MVIVLLMYIYKIMTINNKTLTAPQHPTLGLVNVHTPALSCKVSRTHLNKLHYMSTHVF